MLSWESLKVAFDSSLVKIYSAQNSEAITNESKWFLVGLKRLACNQQKFRNFKAFVESFINASTPKSLFLSEIILWQTSLMMLMRNCFCVMIDLQTYKQPEAAFPKRTLVRKSYHCNFATGLSGNRSQNSNLWHPKIFINFF